MTFKERLAVLPAELTEVITEHAAILEYDAGLPRDEAEPQALADNFAASFLFMLRSPGFQIR